MNFQTRSRGLSPAVCPAAPLLVSQTDEVLFSSITVAVAHSAAFSAAAVVSAAVFSLLLQSMPPGQLLDLACPLLRSYLLLRSLYLALSYSLH